MGDKIEKHLRGMNPSRREAITRLILGTAFAVPAVSTFSVGSASAQLLGGGPICGLSNMTDQGLESSAGHIPNSYFYDGLHDYPHVPNTNTYDCIDHPPG